MSADVLALLDERIAEAELDLKALREARAVLAGTAKKGRAVSAGMRRAHARRVAKDGGPTCGACGKPGHNRRSCKAAEDD
jgi:hypothetical protein